jgi:hypothetical protein
MELVHDMSHYVHSRKNPDKPGHGMHHAWIERSMIEYVVRSGWLEGKLKKPEKPKQPLTQIRSTRILERIKKWEAKERRAKEALKKLRRQAKYYKRVISPEAITE